VAARLTPEGKIQNAEFKNGSRPQPAFMHFEFSLLH
jgi:hypothetical protein